MELENDKIIVRYLLDNLKARGIFKKIFERCSIDIHSQHLFLNWKRQIELYVIKYLSSPEFTSQLDTVVMQKIIPPNFIFRPNIKRFEKGADRITQALTFKMMKYFEPKISIAVDQYLEKKHMFGPMCQNDSECDEDYFY